MLAAVPAWLRADRWHELQRMSRGSALFTWGQHGWRHANHEPCGKKCEFGPARLPKHKHLDLLKGRDRLAAIMGKDFTPIFTPPWNRMDQDSLELLPKLGFRGVSADTKLRPRSAYVRDSMAFLPVHVDLHTRQENTPQEALRGILQDFSNALPLGECGVMLHHQRMNPRPSCFCKGCCKQFEFSRVLRGRELLKKLPPPNPLPQDFQYQGSLERISPGNSFP